MPMSGKAMVKLYQEHGWRVLRQNSSHVRLEKDGDHETIPVKANKDLGKGLESKLLKHLEASK